MGVELAAISAGVGIASNVGSTIASFSQASKQRRMQKEAEATAKKAIEDARKRLDVNFFDELAINKEPYELQREAALQAAQGALQAGMEGETRGAAATAGRVQMANDAAQREIRSAMGNDLRNLEQQSATEDSRLRDEQANLDLAEASGAQFAAAGAANRRDKALAEGFQGVVNTTQMAAAALPLYMTDYGAARRAVGALDQDTRTSLGFPEGVDNMSRSDFKQYVKALPVDYRNRIFGNEQFNKAYQAQLGSGSMINPFMTEFMNPQENK